MSGPGPSLQDSLECVYLAHMYSTPLAGAMFLLTVPGEPASPHQHPLSCWAGVDMHIFLSRMLGPADLLFLGAFLSCPWVKKARKKHGKFPFHLL